MNTSLVPDLYLALVTVWLCFHMQRFVSRNRGKK